MFYAHLVSRVVLSVQLGGGGPHFACYVIFSVSVRLRGSALISFMVQYMVNGRTEGIAVAVRLLEGAECWNLTQRA